MSDLMGLDIGTGIALMDDISKKNALQIAAANFDSITLKETLLNGDTIHALTFIKDGLPYTYDLLTHAGVASYKGQFLNLATVQLAFPIGIADTQFIFTYDEYNVDTNPEGTGVVSLLQYIDSTWTSIKLNQSIPVGKPQKLCRR